MMAKPNKYILVTQKNFLSDDNKGIMIEKNFLEIQGTFLVKIQDNTFNGIIRENAFKHIDNFLKVVGPLKIKGLSLDQFRLSVFPISLARASSEWFKKDCIGSVTSWENLVEKFIQKFYQLFNDNEEMEADEDDDLDDIAEIFKIGGNLFNFKTPLNYKANNVGNTQDSQEHNKECHDPSICQVRRFDMMKYSFDADDEYVFIKEHEHSDHSRTKIDACQAYQELFCIMDEGWLVTGAKDE
nr:hypothetical protein [Tanacetum cinerariifolium]